MLKINLLGFGLTNKSIAKLLDFLEIPYSIFLESSQTFNLYEINKINYDISIISPGINPNKEYLQFFPNIMSEYDFVYMILNALNINVKSIWISGTNGKTTTTEMIGILLKNENARIGGNIGIPLAELLMNDFKNELIKLRKRDFISEKSSDEKVQSNIIWILETSSFSLYWNKNNKPDIYILLPLSSDHIAWHGSFESYKKCKLKPLLQNSNLNAIIPIEFKNNDFKNTFFYENSEHLKCAFNINLYDIKHFKEPFFLDLMISISALKLNNFNFDISQINNYEIGNYRMQEFKIRNILFVNDSKATNENATLNAIKSYKETYNSHEIYLIFGGDSKGANLNNVISYIIENNIKVFLIGKDLNLILEYFHGFKNFKIAITMKNALNIIFQKIKECENLKNHIVILSPACASLDQYESYKARGEEFKNLAYKLFLDSNA